MPAIRKRVSRLMCRRRRLRARFPPPSFFFSLEASLHYRVLGGQRHGETFDSGEGRGCPPRVYFWGPQPVPRPGEIIPDLTIGRDVYRPLDVARGEYRRETILVPEQMSNEDALRLWEKAL